MAVILAFSRELSRRSRAESIFRHALREDAALSLDAAYFSDAAGTAAVHAGLLNGVTPITASAATDPTAAMLDDMAALASAVASGGSGQIVFIARRGGRAGMALWGSDLQVEVLAVRRRAGRPADRRRSGLDRACLRRRPEIFASHERHAAHEDTTPLPIATGARRLAVVARRRESLFQPATIALRCLLDVAFRRPKRRDNAVSYIDSVRIGDFDEPVSPHLRTIRTNFRSRLARETSTPTKPRIVRPLTAGAGSNASPNRSVVAPILRASCWARSRTAIRQTQRRADDFGEGASPSLRRRIAPSDNTLSAH